MFLILQRFLLEGQGQGVYSFRMHQSMESRSGFEPRREVEKRTDDELIERVVSGDQKAWTELQERYQDRLTLYVRKFLKKNEDADEVVNESFYRASTHLEGFKLGVPFWNWLVRLARNIAYDRLRYNQYRSQVQPFAHLEDVAGTVEGDPEAAFAQREMHDRLMDALGELTESLRDAYVLVEIEELSSKDAADRLGIPESTMRVRVYRAKEKLRGLLSDLELGYKEAA